MLNRHQDQYRRTLNQKERELSAKLGRRESIAIQERMPDALLSAKERDLAIQNLSREAELLNEVRAALSRMRSGALRRL